MHSMRGSDVEGARRWLDQQVRWEDRLRQLRADHHDQKVGQVADNEVVVRTICTAEVTEEWRIAISPEVGAKLDYDEWLDVLDHPEEFGAEIRSVANVEVQGERDRERVA